ncbi:MAG TPA: tetratricopeptide repeat protein [Labilithrix sp.]|nr:tetratricopeptide repeat protein [Labilithrix sp.]
MSTKPARATNSRESTAAPEEFLRKAMAARSARSRAMYARRGLATTGPLDRTTHAMLLRQLYLSLFEGRRFRQAHTVALQALELDVLADVLNQDAARAALADGDLENALAHLRAAARRGPASRRPFHLWTLGGTLFLAQRYAEAAAALARAARWGTNDKPLYRAHLALARIAAGEKVDDLEDTIIDLAEAPCGQGYGRFVLGHLAYAAGEWTAAKRYLEAFLKRTTNSRPALGIALEGEIRMTRATLAKISAN